MWRDPIVEEVRRWRQDYAAKLNHDLKAICRDLRERQAKSGRKVVSLPPKRIQTGSPESQPAA
jgi:hypothetical protein